MKIQSLIAALTAAALSAGCVTQQTHDATLAELNAERARLEAARSTIVEQSLQIQANQNEIARGHKVIADLEQQRVALDTALAASQQRLAEEQARLEVKQGELAGLEARLGESRRQLETLRQIEAETQARNAIYARFVQALKQMIDGGQLTVSIEAGRIVLNLPEAVLFPSGSATVSPRGRETLTEIARVLAQFGDRRFQVEGHTDTVPIRTARFPSNWALASGRALSVVHLMIEAGVSPSKVSAAGFGEFHPRADNATAEGRSQNRRIEIVMQPNLDILSSELPRLAP